MTRLGYIRYALTIATTYSTVLGGMGWDGYVQQASKREIWELGGESFAAGHGI